MQNYEKYIFADSVQISGSKYIYQYVKNRKLTGIAHYHDFYEICYVLRGHCTEIHNGKELLIKENEMTVISPGGFHLFKSQSENLILVCLSIEKDEFLKIANSVSEDVVEYIEKNENSGSFKVFGTTHGALYKNPFLTVQHDLDYKYLLAFMLVSVSKNMIFGAEETNGEFVSKITNIPASDIAEGGIETLERASGYSRSQLTRLMKKNFGKTPWEYINDLRMSYAYNRLAFTNIKTGDIADKCGFESLSHFSNAFKKQFGVTPSKIRKKHLSSTV